VFDPGSPEPLQAENKITAKTSGNAKNRFFMRFSI
jgi:hypothetical protein